jgi:thymidylate kinase
VIIEFVGCTGAGKTTIISEIQQMLAPAALVSSSYQFLAKPYGLGNVRHRVVRSIIQEVIVLPVFLRTMRSNKAIITFSLEMLKRQPTFSISTLNILRAIERKIGVLEKIKRDAGDMIVLVDEGTIHLAHKMFVFSNANYTSDEIAKFAQLVPVPDLIVYVKAPVIELVERTLKRPDPPREIKANRSKTEMFINRACDMFECIIRQDNIKGRVLTIENSGLQNEAPSHVASRVARHILNHDSNKKKASAIRPQLSWKN